MAWPMVWQMASTERPGPLHCQRPASAVGAWQGVGEDLTESSGATACLKC